MNKKGQSFMLSAFFAVMIFLFGMVLINFVFPDATLARTSLNCDNASEISDGNKLTCLIVDLAVPYVIILVISLAGGRILSKIIV